MDVRAFALLAAGIVTAGAAAGAALGDGKVISAALEGMARQPEAQNLLFRNMLIGVGVVEATPIIGIVIAFILLFTQK
jgi:F-type H+-transporting ATPase subunit c